MYDFILQISLIASLTIVVYLMARALPRVQEAESQPKFFDYLEKWLRKLPIAKIDHSLNNYFEKSLRRAKVVVMKADNAINNRLNHKKNGAADNGSSAELIDKIKNGDSEEK